MLTGLHHLLEIKSFIPSGIRYSTMGFEGSAVTQYRFGRMVPFSTIPYTPVSLLFG
jgi:hypothetical protein